MDINTLNIVELVIICVMVYTNFYLKPKKRYHITFIPEEDSIELKDTLNDFGSKGWNLKKMKISEEGVLIVFER